jgi:sterol desaturase/sphingolipid hydroxylase (fatty acid hydroxylase superfamily)
MPQTPIDRSPEPIRLFQSSFFERLTHISPLVVLILWAPVCGCFLVAALLDRPARTSLLYIPLAWLLGLFIWTFVEYVVHRFVFHFRPRTPWQERVLFLFHGVHHAQPQAKTRLVMPPAVSIPLALFFYGLFYMAGSLLASARWVAPLFSGFVAGYLTYDMLHYATHHLPMRGKLLKYLKRHHMLHHFKTPDQRFGVSSPLWDIVFGTMG